MPFNRNKWGLYLEPSYQKYAYKRVETEHSSSGVLFENTYVEENENQYISCNLGLRHYMFVNSNASIFVGGSYNLIQDKFKSKRDNVVSEGTDGYTGLSYAIGVDFLHKYNLEFRGYGGGKIANYSIVLGYTIFNNKYHKK